jgi:hypothetical protein
VYSKASHTKNSAALTPMNTKLSTVNAISLAGQRRKSVPADDARELTLARKMFPNMTTSGTGAIIPKDARSAECHKNSISKGAGKNKGNVKMLLAVIRSDLGDAQN